MSEEEKKIKEMEELGIRLVDSPSETVAKASPTKLKLQALTFMVIGKIERYFLGNMLKQAKEARNLAEVGLRKTDMTLDDKMAFKEYLDSNITLLEEKMALFDKNYKRVIGRGKRSLKIPSTNIKILFANGIIKKHKQKTMIDMVDAYKQMNDVFSTAKTEFSGMPKPIKRDVEVSKAEQDNIRQAVYEALSNTDDKEVEKYASSFDKKEETIDDVIRNSNYSENKEKKLDDFFNNVSSGKSHDKLDNESLGQVLNKGKVKEKESKSLENKQLDEVLNGGKPIFSNLTNNTSIFDGSPTISSTGYIGKNDSRKNADYDKMLADDDIVSLTDRLTKNKENLVFNKPLSNNEYVEIGESSVPNVVDLRAKLDESINEIERKRQAKEEARKKYEAEKQAREQEENELSESKRLIAEMRKEIERKREEQKAIEELNQKVEKALKYQRQIEENRRAALEEEEEARKYQETLRIEKENQTKVAQEKEKLQSERVVLQSETSKVDSSLQKEKEKLEEARRQLQMFNTSMNVAEVSTNAYSQIEPFDVKHDDFFAKFNAQPSKRR
ncbi:unknown [Clostridium sp. CAG:451]|nr:unknown [Clostridium sp. CAG:451]